MDEDFGYKPKDDLLNEGLSPEDITKLTPELRSLREEIKNNDIPAYLLKNCLKIFFENFFQKFLKKISKKKFKNFWHKFDSKKF